MGKSDITFKADRNTANSIDYAYAMAVANGASGITKDGTIVTTMESLTLQLREKNLVLSFIRYKTTVDVQYHGDIKEDNFTAFRNRALEKM